MYGKCYVCGKDAHGSLDIKWGKGVLERNPHLQCWYSVCLEHGFADVMEKLKELGSTCCQDFYDHTHWFCEQHSSPWECPDAIIVKTEIGYGIPIKDGGSSFIMIHYCPWCGKELK